MERIQGWCQFNYEVQQEKAAQYGHVCGCPYASIGAEVATRDEKIRIESERMFQCGRKYVESAIADAARAGVVTVNDPILAAQRVYSMATGMMVEAKVQNNLETMKDMEPTIMAILGAKTVSV